jgi:LuxR family maltose regulon positive regulatory protein
LIERTNAGLHRKLTLASGPAGFGKTTLLSEWVQARRGATSRTGIAWLSLDEDDNDLNRFLPYIVATLQTFEGKLGKGVLALLQSPGILNVEQVLTTLLNEITGLPGKVVLFLDDYHVIESQLIDKALTFLLDHLPAQMHRIIASRTEPALPLSRLRARGQLTELRFTPDEAAVFVKQVVCLPVSPDDVRAEGSHRGLDNRAAIGCCGNGEPHRT